MFKILRLFKRFDILFAFFPYILGENINGLLLIKALRASFWNKDNLHSLFKPCLY